MPRKDEGQQHFSIQAPSELKQSLDIFKCGARLWASVTDSDWSVKCHERKDTRSWQDLNVLPREVVFPHIEMELPVFQLVPVGPYPVKGAPLKRVLPHPLDIHPLDIYKPC